MSLIPSLPTFCLKPLGMSGKPFKNPCLPLEFNNQRGVPSDHYLKEGCLYNVAHVVANTLLYLTTELAILAAMPILGLEKIIGKANDCGAIIATITTLFCDIIAIPFALVEGIGFLLTIGIGSLKTKLYTNEDRYINNNNNGII